MKTEIVTATVFMEDKYIDTNVPLYTDKIVVVRYMGEDVKIKVKEIKENGYMVALVN